MERRSFLGAILAGFASPAIVSARNLMPIQAPKLILPDEIKGDVSIYAGGITWVDDKYDCRLFPEYDHRPFLEVYRQEFIEAFESHQQELDAAFAMPVIKRGNRILRY